MDLMDIGQLTFRLGEIDRSIELLMRERVELLDEMLKLIAEAMARRIDA